MTDRTEAARRGVARAGVVDRRSALLAAVVMLVVLVGGVIAVAVFVDDGPRRDTQGQLGAQGGDKPHIIERPNSGTAPRHAGDRGGWEQLGLFALLAAALVGIGVAIFRSGGRARANREAWRTAAATGHDGAVDGAGRLVDDEPRAER